jgi:hypothetical protein
MPLDAHRLLNIKIVVLRLLARMHSSLILLAATYGEPHV